MARQWLRVLAAVCVVLPLRSLAAVNPVNVSWAPTVPIDLAVRQRTSALAKTFANFSARGDIRDIITRIKQEETENYILHLSGEYFDSLQNSRVSDGIGPLHPYGIMHAIEYVQKAMVTLGYDVELAEYRTDYAPNVIACVRGEVVPDEIVIMGAHLDDIPRSGRAPGANDNGSGSASLMAAAQALADSGFKLRRTVCFEWYTGEEQGLIGSRAQAMLRKERGDDVVAMFSQDMIGYHLSMDDPGVAFVTDPRAVDPDLTDTMESIAREYADPLLIVHKTVLSGSSCCSDHQSYKEAGFPSAGLIEPRGYTGDPTYHTDGDLVRRSDFDTEQVYLVARLGLAAAASIANVIDTP